MKRCSKCEVEKELDEFYNNRSKPDGKQSICKPCKRKMDVESYHNNSHHRERVLKNKKTKTEDNAKFLYEYFCSHPCVDCGESDPVVLEFDHIKDKKRQVSHMKTYSRKAILDEIAKCVIRCSNCHKRKTAKEHGWYKKYDIRD